MQGKKLDFIINTLYYALAAALCFFVLCFLLPRLWPFLFGLGLASLFRHLSRLFRLQSKAAVAVIGVLFYASVVFLFWLFLVLFTGQLVNTARWFPAFFAESLHPAAQQLGDRFIEILQTLAPAFAMSVGELFDLVAVSFTDFVTGASTALLSGITSFLKRLPLFLIGFVFMIVSSFAIAMDYNRVSSFLLRQLPPAARPLMLDIKNFLISCLFKLLRAYAIILCITFAELTIGLWALRIENFWKIAAIVALLDILPLIGSGAFLIPWGIYHLIGGELALGFGILILYGVVAVVRSIVEPRVVGDQLGLHPVVTLAAMFFGLRTFGFIGMIAAPVTALLVRFLNSTGKVRLYRTES